LAERLALTQKVVGSIPTRPAKQNRCIMLTNKHNIDQLQYLIHQIESLLSKKEVKEVLEKIVMVNKLKGEYVHIDSRRIMEQFINNLYNDLITFDDIKKDVESLERDLHYEIDELKQQNNRLLDRLEAVEQGR